jgi:hypothetical protein
MTKVCSRCKQEKDLSEFYAVRRDTKCKDCIHAVCKLYRINHMEQRKAYRKQWKRANREKVNEQRRQYLKKYPDRTRATNLKAKYGITIEQWNARFTSQDNKCAICGAPDPGAYGKWHTDHDHTTNTVRGILCQQCNTGLGKLKESKALLVKAQEYLASAVDSTFVYKVDMHRRQHKQHVAIQQHYGCKCGICGATDPGRATAWLLDHNHKTGMVRGLLCSNCNLGIGNFKDFPMLLHQALVYLEAGKEAITPS